MLKLFQSESNRLKEQLISFFLSSNVFDCFLGNRPYHFQIISNTILASKILTSYDTKDFFLFVIKSIFTHLHIFLNYFSRMNETSKKKKFMLRISNIYFSVSIFAFRSRRIAEKNSACVSTGQIVSWHGLAFLWLEAGRDPCTNLKPFSEWH